MDSIPEYIKRIVDYEAELCFLRHHYYIIGYLDVEDFIQACYLRIHRQRLWSAPGAIIRTVSRFACKSTIRSAIPGFRQRKPLIHVRIRSYEGMHYDLDGGAEKMHDALSLKSLLDTLSPRYKHVILSIINGESNVSIGKRLGCSGSRISQIKSASTAAMRKRFQSE